MNKIPNPVVLIHKREHSDSYAVAVTSNSNDYRDANLLASMEPDMVGDEIDTWSKTGYYMAAEIERLRQQLIAPLSIGELLHRLELQTGEKWERVVNDGTSGKQLAITLPPLPVLGSTDEWYQGFAAGAASMRDECQNLLVAVGISVEVK